ncbi:MAG: BMP family ABC transporter substrate-binding protein [Lachnospiraceae bacterium]
MKKISLIMAILLFGCSVLLGGCAKETTAAQSTAAKGPIALEDIKIGMAHFSDPSDQGYTYNHDQSTWKMAEALGIDESQIINKYNVPDDSEAATAFRELAEEGCQIIFSTSHGHEDYLLEVAEEYPDITFCHFNGTKAADSGLANVHNFFGEISQVRYLSGVVAGLTTKSNKIGYVAAMDYAEVNNGLDAYYLGAKSVNPEIEVVATYLNSWYDPAFESQATQSLIDNGCDVISHHADSTAGAMVSEKNGAYYISYNSDMSSVAPKAVLTSVRWDTSSYLIMAVQAVLDGKQDEIPVDYLGTLEDGMVYLDPIHYDLLDDATAQAVKSAVEADTEAFKSDTKEVFVGPMKDIDGTTVLEDQEVFVEPKSAPSFGYVLEGIEVIK